MKNTEQIENELWRAEQWTTNEVTDVPALSYEQGVVDALSWVLEYETSFPIQEDYENKEGDYFNEEFETV